MRTERRNPKAKIFIISAPSGAGKTTLCNRLFEDGIGLANSVSMTTRPPRPGEREGVDYHFVTRKRFESMARAGGFLEYEENFGNLYGTPRKFVEENLKKGRGVLLSVDVKGAMKVRNIFRRNSVLIFLLPPSMRELKKRLHMRKSDDTEAVRRRFALAKKEISYRNIYDYRIVNDKLDSSYKKLKRVIEKEAEG